MAIFNRKNKKDSRSASSASKDSTQGKTDQRQVSSASTASAASASFSPEQPPVSVSGVFPRQPSNSQSPAVASSNGSPNPSTVGGPAYPGHASAPSSASSTSQPSAPAGRSTSSPLGMRSNQSPAQQSATWPNQLPQPGNQGPSNQGPPGPPAQMRSPSAASAQYPWTRHTIANHSPFPRYGHAANAIAARDGEVFVMGGLKGSNVFGDLWVIETDTLSGYILETEGCPSPRVGHASLTLGNAFIVFGGDTKIEETDLLDDNLYLLNTTTLKWTVANALGPRPSGRYGHTISTVGSKVYVFGGQLDDKFFDDLMCYDLTTLRSSAAQWEPVEVLSQARPPPRTNHTIVTFQDKLYLFGGTDGRLWYSDTWCFDPVDGSWTALDCSGFVPAPCEGHAATIVGDVMYIFGGRSSQGQDLGVLSALKLSTRKWFTFQNLGPGPSPRSGHSMSVFAGNKVLVMGGESPDLNPHEDYETQNARHSSVFILDTQRINYPPPDGSTAPISESSPIPPAGSRAINGSHGSPITAGHPLSPVSPSAPHMPHGVANIQPAGAFAREGASPTTVPGSVGHFGSQQFASEAPVEPSLSQGFHGGATPKQVSHPTYASPAQNYPEPVQKSIEERADSKARSYSDDGYDSKSNTTFESVDSDGFQAKQIDETVTNGTNGVLPLRQDSPTRQVANIPGGWKQTPTPPSVSPSPSAQDNSILVQKTRQSIESDSTMPAISNGHTPGSRSIDDSIPEHIIVDQSTPRASQSAQQRFDDETPENVSSVMEQLKASNTWYESELAAAREAGYVPSSRPPVDVLKLRRVSQRLTQDTDGSLKEREILIAAINELKDDLNSVQLNVQKQAEEASKRISAAEQERDNALSAVAQLKSQVAAPVDPSIHEQKISELQKQLSDAHASRSLLLSDTDGLSSIDDLKADKLNLEQQLRSHADKLVLAEHNSSQLQSQLAETQKNAEVLHSTTAEHVAALGAASAALAAAHSRSTELHQQVEGHKSARVELENRVHALEQELADHKHQLTQSQRELDEARPLLQHTNEQADHSSRALNSGVERIVTLWSGSKAFGGQRGIDGTPETGNDDDADERVASLRSRLDTVTQLHSKEKSASETATSQLTHALNQISGLKRELANSEAARHELESKSAAADHERTRALGDLDQHRTQLDEHKRLLSDITDQHNKLSEQVTQQTQASSATTKELSASLEKALYEHKQATDLHQARYNGLEEEYNKTLQYVRNSDKALGKTRDELTRHKELNTKLQEQIDELRLRTQQDDDEDADNTVGERSTASVGSYNSRQFDIQLRDLRAQVIILQEERDELRNSTMELKKKAINHNQDLDEVQQTVQRLTKENQLLSTRTKQAEAKLASLGNGAVVDPESGKTLDAYADDLDKIRSDRERLSGILRDSPTLDEYAT